MCLHGCQSKKRIIQCARGKTGNYFFSKEELFTGVLILDRAKVECWQVLYTMINISLMDPCLYMCVYEFVRACVCAGSPCSLLLSPLCEACPPLEGPGVPAECVEVASSWSLQEAGF